MGTGESFAGGGEEILSEFQEKEAVLQEILAGNRPSGRKRKPRQA